jgi:hypothetical protein
LVEISVNIEDDIEHTARQTVLGRYSEVPASFYNISPHTTSTNINTTTSEAEQLIEVAKDPGCTYLISSHIGNALLNTAKLCTKLYCQTHRGVCC